MPRLAFTPQLRRFTSTPEVESSVATLREALEVAFGGNPQLRGYVLEDRCHLRPNVAAFLDGRCCCDRVALNDPLRVDSRSMLLQALSGG